MDYEVKADALEASFDGVVMAAERPVLAAADDARVESGFAAFVRSGVAMERKSFNGGTGAEGGFAVPKEIDARIDDTLKTVSPIRRIANVVTVGTAGYRKLVASGGVASGWVSETGARTETATPVFNEIAPSMGELYANPAASQAMLDDAAFDVEGWLAEEIAAEFGRAEGAAFVSGNGTNKPKGFLAYPTANTADGVRAFGTLQYLATGYDGQFPAANATDKLIDLVQSLRSPYRQGAVWVMNSKTIAALRKFKTGDGLPVWQPSVVEGAPSVLLGYPVIEAEDMPDVASGSFSVAFGNFSAGYLIAERAETSVLRDPYSNKPFTYFYAVKRVGGCVTNSEAIKLLKFSVT